MNCSLTRYETAKTNSQARERTTMTMLQRDRQATSEDPRVDTQGGRERPTQGGRECPEPKWIGGPRVSTRGAENVPLRNKRRKEELGPTMRIQPRRADHVQTGATATTTRSTR